MVLQQKTLHWQYQTQLEERGQVVYTNPSEKMQEIKREKKKRIQKDTALPAEVEHTRQRLPSHEFVVTPTIPKG
jgi:hypothetical protein